MSKSISHSSQKCQYNASRESLKIKNKGVSANKEQQRH